MVDWRVWSRMVWAGRGVERQRIEVGEKRRGGKAGGGYEWFVAADQELMSEALNYRRWLFSLVESYVAGDVLEVGAGIGNMSEVVLKQRYRCLRSLTCIEPEESCIRGLERVLAGAECSTKIVRGSFPECVAGAERRYDLVFHFSVLEHIENDTVAIEAAWELLREGGFHFAFVPAFPVLFGSMDRRLRHFRRYRRKELVGKFENAGFDVVAARYYNLVGFFGWLWNNRIVKIRAQEAGQIAVFDRVVLPVQRVVEAKIRWPVGQNLVVIGRKAVGGGRGKGKGRDRVRGGVSRVC